MNLALGAFLLSLISFFVSAGAVIVSIRQHRAQKEHNRLSVRPYINLVHETTTEFNDISKVWVGVLKVIIINNGTGPALVECFDIFVDGKLIVAEQDKKWNAALERLLPVDNSKPLTHFGYGVFNLAKGYCIPSGERIILFTIRFTLNMGDYIKAAIDRSRSVLVYKSFYNTVYTYDTDKVKRGEIEPFN